MPFSPAAGLIWVCKNHLLKLELCEIVLSGFLSSVVGVARSPLVGEVQFDGAGGGSLSAVV